VPAGVVIPPAGYFEKIQAVLKKYDIYFIADEVICGFARTGNMFGSETFNMKPDSVSVAKALSSAYFPIAAVTVGEEMYQAMIDESKKIGTFGHGFTYTAHPVGAAIAAKTLEIYEKRNIVGHVRSLAPRFEGHVERLAEHPLVGHARAKGLLGAIELVDRQILQARLRREGRHRRRCRCRRAASRSHRPRACGRHRRLLSAAHHRGRTDRRHVRRRPQGARRGGGPSDQRRAARRLMPELRYQLTFEGTVSPEDEMGSRMNILSVAAIPPGLDAALTQGGRSATLSATVETDDYGGFTETGEISFGAGAIRYSTRGEGFIEDTEEEDIQQGCVIRQVEGGSGIFENATGYIVSTFTVSEDAVIRDSQSAVVFVA